MLRKMLLAATFGLGISATLLTGGCAADKGEKPYSLTGTEQERKERLRYTDAKGHYRPDLRAQGQPLR